MGALGSRFGPQAVSKAFTAIKNALRANDPSDGDINVHSGRIYEQGVPVARAPGSSIDPGLGFNTWRTPNTDKPTQIAVRASAETDGSSDAQVSLLVDEGEESYNLSIAWADNGLSSGGRMFSSLCIDIPAGASYMIDNAADPNNSNGISTHREFTL